MLRLLWVLLLATLLGSGGVAAGLAAGVPTIVQFVFVGCLGLFVVTLATGALMVTDTDAPRQRNGAAESAASAITSRAAEAHDADLRAHLPQAEILTPE